MHALGMWAITNSRWWWRSQCITRKIGFCRWLLCSQGGCLWWLGVKSPTKPLEGNRFATACFDCRKVCNGLFTLRFCSDIFTCRVCNIFLTRNLCGSFITHQNSGFFTRKILWLIFHLQKPKNPPKTLERLEKKKKSALVACSKPCLFFLHFFSRQIQAIWNPKG